GNIWTLKNYKDQPGGQFKFDSFLKQIAVSDLYGRHRAVPYRAGFRGSLSGAGSNLRYQRGRSQGHPL
uniref:hypothetical protein n=1 Tax=Vibrio cholerae TaxID=666 RepID=UPI001C116FD1